MCTSTMDLLQPREGGEGWLLVAGRKYLRPTHTSFYMRTLQNENTTSSSACHFNQF